ncbi:MAG: oxidoreductase [Acidimicrobiales bacterium]|jgi:NAD(P)-dependent dehydrogenase (short-subunit alcohol dehydrogenase family)|nr:oxidoreductase [Acidimicrobiales bacterium]
MANPSDLTVPDQSGRVVVITGANSGIGYQAALRLAQAGAEVVLACRNPAKAAEAETRILAGAADAEVRVVELDLASQASVRTAAEQLRADYERIDLLVNNAGVMAIPRRETVDGFETQLATNHLGHFALTGLLLDRVLAAPDSRIVTVSSTAHRMGRIRFDDLQGAGRYQNWRAYGQSKLANLLFAFELQRRLSASGAATLSLAVHPGWSATHLQTSGRGVTSGPMHAMTSLANRVFAQSDAMGALPTLYAATAADVEPGGFYGPGGLFEVQGMPERVDSTSAAKDPDVARRLWEVSEDLTGVRYELTSV